MLVVIYNDAAYGAEVHHFRPHGHPVELVQFPDTDFAALASAAGARGVTVRSTDDLAPSRPGSTARDGPLVVDAKITPDFCAEWLEEAFK
jgi:thiamine pyrophosphate-dependent acetolactate synthase large subunit-like protein